MFPGTVIEVAANKYPAPPPDPPPPPADAPTAPPFWPLHPPRTNVKPSAAGAMPFATAVVLLRPSPPLSPFGKDGGNVPPAPPPLATEVTAGDVPAPHEPKFAPAPAFATVRLLDTSS